MATATLIDLLDALTAAGLKGGSITLGYARLVEARWGLENGWAPRGEGMVTLEDVAAFTAAALERAGIVGLAAELGEGGRDCPDCDADWLFVGDSPCGDSAPRRPAEPGQAGQRSFWTAQETLDELWSLETRFDARELLRPIAQRMLSVGDGNEAAAASAWLAGCVSVSGPVG